MNTNLRKMREKRRMTQKETALKSHITLRSYQYYESGERIPDVYAAIRIARVLDSTVETLFDLFQSTAPVGADEKGDAL